jgi:ComF family protein
LQVVRIGVVYGGLAKEIVWRLKFKGASAAAAEMVRHLPDVFPAGVVIVPVPTATSRVRRRGYDQAKLLARELANRRQIPYLDCLARSGQSHQVGASRRERLRQLSGAFRVRYPARVEGAHLVLVDDVLTTGATLEAAAVALKQAGAKKVEAAVFAQP